ncbi:hypothetical protein [Crateriforma conspicua]|uniref:hypothetical protein n=1 Tax=Crateriforma conspicua TaxID=2527996 RepID=UPI0013FD011C|nr:hypothetical protein [Crateriforma conspicua]
MNLIDFFATADVFNISVGVNDRFDERDVHEKGEDSEFETLADDPPSRTNANQVDWSTTIPAVSA